MKVVFYSARFAALREQWEGVQMLGFGYLAAHLRRSHPDVQCLLARTEEEVLGSGADLVGITCTTFTYGQARRMAAQSRERLGAVTVLGGPHLTALPERMDREFDFGVLGEGEETFAELVGQLLQSRPPAQPEQIGGLVHWRGDERVINPLRDPIDDLDSLPFPDRSLYDQGGALRRGRVSIMTSRGCPYTCNFCAARGHWGGMRIHSADYVLSEMEDVIQRYRPWQIVFEDDLFIGHRRRFDAIVEGILQKGYHRRVCFHVSGRANLLTGEICARLKAINTRSVFLGLESASNKVLERLGKNGVTAETNQAALDCLARSGLRVVGTFILGTPGETFEEMIETYRFARRNLDVFDSVSAGVLRLLPGTPFWDEGVARGLVDESLTGIVFEDRDAEDGWESLQNRYPMLCETMTRHELLAMTQVFQELSCLVQERHSGTRNIDTMSIRGILKKVVRRIRQKLARRFSFR